MTKVISRGISGGRRKVSKSGTRGAGVKRSRGSNPRSTLTARLTHLEKQFIAMQEALRQTVAAVNVILDETEPVEDGDAGMSGGEV